MEYGLIGETLGHSYSPLIHRCFGDYDYQLYPMTRAEMISLLQRRDFKGINVTIPYKRDVLAYCDEISPAVRAIGSANTLLMRSGRLCAENTDLRGFLTMLEKGGISLAGKKVAILGSGGTSLTAQAACRKQGAKEAIVVSRTGAVDYEKLYARHSDVQVLINTTPVGMYPHMEETPADLTRLPALSGVVDVIYNPARTQLLRSAEKRGLSHVGGLWMLVSQGWHAAQLFLDRSLPPERMDDAYRAVCQRMEEAK